MKQERFQSISVFLPALNEQENIKICVQSLQKYLSSRFKDYEILVVSNGSTDNTEKIVKELAKKDKHIKLINDRKIGYGEALKSGFRHSLGDIIFYTDADNQYNIEDLDILLPMLSSYDIVSGFRIKRKDPLMRIFVGEVYNLVIKFLFNLNVRDIDASFKLYKKEVLKDIRLKSNTGLIDAEVLIKAKKKGFKIGQIGVAHYPRTKGQTVYEVGKRNEFFGLVRPRVILDVLGEIKDLWSELRS